MQTWSIELQDDGFYTIWYNHRGTSAALAENIGEYAIAKLFLKALSTHSTIDDIQVMYS